MRSALQGGSEGTTGNSRKRQHQGTCRDQHQFRSRHHASFRSMRTNCAEREASDAIDMAGRPDIWLNRSFSSRRRNEDGVTLDCRIQDAQPLISSRVRANHIRWLFEYSPAAQRVLEEHTAVRGDRAPAFRRTAVAATIAALRGFSDIAWRHAKPSGRPAHHLIS
jgi:hypothetical protein